MLLQLTDLRRDVLAGFETLPVSAEYMHREVFDITTRLGKDTMVMNDKLGTEKLPTFFALKGAVDARLNRIPFLNGFSDRCMQVLSALRPRILSKRMTDFRDRFEHHLILKMHDVGHLYKAKSDLAELYKSVDPTNSINPGIGKMSRRKYYA